VPSCSIPNSVCNKSLGRSPWRLDMQFSVNCAPVDLPCSCKYLTTRRSIFLKITNGTLASSGTASLLHETGPHVGRERVHERLAPAFALDETVNHQPVKDVVDAADGVLLRGISSDVNLLGNGTRC